MDIATLKATSSEKSNEGQNSETNTVIWSNSGYNSPFYNMDLNETVEFSFLPDLDDILHLALL